ncbi:MAG: DEAD/DEAH box helicase [Candidatus Aenigmatarchaeota archaeon]
MTLREFIEKYSSTLTRRIEESLTPVYNPLVPEGVEEYEGKMPSLLRKPFPVQAEIIKGLSKALYRAGRRHLFLVGEMGTGKTMVSLGVVAMSPKPMRTLVVCPTHMVEKWKRETKETIPDVEVIDLSGRDAVTILDGLRDGLRQVNGKPQNHHQVYVISKERAKLGYGWRAAAVMTKRSKFPRCPDCGEIAMHRDTYLTIEALSRKRYTCNCGSPLWQADRKLKRFAPAEFIKKYLKGYFDLVIIDEVHDYKAGDSLQGDAMGKLLAHSKMSLCLTGTLNGGYADDLFFLLYRTDPWKIKGDGFEYRQVERWLTSFGTIEEIRKIEEKDSYYYGRTKKKGVITKKKPGVSPLVIGRYLLDKSAFIRLADVIDGLPPYEETVITVPMAEDHQTVLYCDLEGKLRDAIARYHTRVLGAMLQSLLSYPDSCVLYGENIEIKDAGVVMDVIKAPRLTTDKLLPKEEELISLARKEKSSGRKVLCYLTFTGSRDIRPRLMEILKKAGFRVASLDASVEPKKRESWIAKHAKDIDVLLVNAELVKTGLDLYDFPTVVFYQVGYNIFTLRQAARRSWRIGQRQPVRVYFMCYQGTMQETALTLIARKLEVALMVEGDLPEGLAEYVATGDSIIEEMGKALVEGGNYGGAERAWASLRKKEVEAQLGINGRETIFQESSQSRANRPDAVKTTVTENVVVKVTVVSGKKRKMSTLEVEYGQLDSLLEGRVAQFAMF